MSTTAKQYRREQLEFWLSAAHKKGQDGDIGDARLRQIVRTIVADLTPASMVRIGRAVLKEYERV
jgi:hypothetical protein